MTNPKTILPSRLAEMLAQGSAVLIDRSGMRTGANCDRLRQCAPGDSHILEGGVDAWTGAGFPVEANPKAPIELNRQVQIFAGLMVLAGVGLGFAVGPAFFGLAAVIGAALVFAGLSGFCGAARLLAFAPCASA